MESQTVNPAMGLNVVNHLVTGYVLVVDEYIIVALGRNSVLEYWDARNLSHLAWAVTDDNPGPRFTGWLAAGWQNALDETFSHRKSSPDDNAQFDNRVEDDVETREMLAVEDEHRVIENPHVAHRVLVRALALVMHHRRRQEPVLVASLDDAVTQVNVLAVHEEILVKTAQLLQHGGAAQHIGARQDVDALRLLVTQVAQVILGEPR